MLMDALLDLACIQLMVGDTQIEPGEESFTLVAHLINGIRRYTVNLLVGH